MEEIDMDDYISAKLIAPGIGSRVAMPTEPVTKLVPTMPTLGAPGCYY